MPFCVSVEINTWYGSVLRSKYSRKPVANSQNRKLCVSLMVLRHQYVLLLALVHAQNGPTEDQRKGAFIRKGGVRVENKSLKNVIQNIVVIISAQENSARNKEVCSTMILFEQLAKSIDYPSLVQKGAVCQWWLSCVKQVRPGMLHVSLFWSLLRNFRSFFLRFCSFCNHWVFCFDGILINTKHTSQLAWVRNSKLLHSKRVLYILPEWEHSSCIKLESLLIRSEITEKTKSAVRCAESLCWCCHP